MTEPLVSRSPSILVIEDDKPLNKLLVAQLGRLGYTAHGVENRAEALGALARFRPDLALLDLRLPDTDGLKFLPELREYCQVIILTAYGSIDQAVQVVRAGAADYLVKPVSAQNLELALKRFNETAAMVRDLAFWQEQARHGLSADVIGKSPQMAEAHRLISLFANSDRPVMILGESGVGKEHVARALHAASPRSNTRMIAIDCDAGPAGAELFGELRETDAGVPIRHEGLIAAAEAGTVFLSCVDRLSADLQAKLLRTIETATYRPLGSSTWMPTAARFLVSSSKEPDEAGTDGGPRNELLMRLSAFSIELPPLRERRADIAPLAESFLVNRNFQRNIPKKLSAPALAALNKYDWPGNVRELRNTIERALIMSAGDATIQPAHLGIASGRGAAAGGSQHQVNLHFDAPPTLEVLRDTYLRMLLESHQGNRRRVAGILGISERNTYRLIQKLGEP